MGIFDMFRRKTPLVEPEDELEDFIAVSLVPCKLYMTAELIRRRREEELRNKYCNPAGKVGVMI